MNALRRSILPLSLAAFLSLTGCASPAAAPASESKALPEAASVSSADPQADSVELLSSADPLSEYAGELSGLYGEEYSASVYQDKKGDAILYDSSQVPTQVMGSAIADFDGDGEQELVAAVLNDDHSFRLELYEARNGQVSKTDTLDLSEEWAQLPQIIGAPDYVSIADFFTYGSGTPLVGLEISQSAGVFVDGVKLDFFSVSCKNDALHLDGHASTSGSDGVYSYYYMDTLASLGIYPPWEPLFNQTRYVREYVENYEDFVRISTSYSVDWREANQWLESGTEPLECASIHFASTEELSENTQTTRDAYQEPPEHAAALQKYESALCGFCYDRKWPDGEKLEEMEGGVSDFSKNQYAVADVDGDQVPELILRFSETFVAAQAEQVWHYDSDTDSLRCELTVYPWCTYYDNGVVKAPAAHNHTPSEFWPFSLYQFNASTGEFDFVGSVYARDKDSGMDDEPFPSEADKDGDGRVFYLNEDTAIDNAEFEAWEQSILNGGTELSPEWQEMDTGDFDGIMG